MDSEKLREAVESAPDMHDDQPFVDAWRLMEAAGYMYSDSNIAKVHMGWIMALAHPPTESAGEVVQADRDAAANLIEKWGDWDGSKAPLLVGSIRLGEADNRIGYSGDLLKTLARHRLSSSERERRLLALAEMAIGTLEGIAKDVDACAWLNDGSLESLRKALAEVGGRDAG